MAVLGVVARVGVGHGSQCTLGKEGVSEVHGYGTLSPFEQALVDENVPALIKMAQKGTDFVKNN